MNGEVPPCIQIPQSERSMRDVRIGNNKLYIGILKVVFVSLIVFFIFAMISLLFQSSILCIISLSVPVVSAIAVLVIPPSFTVAIPSDAHVCDLRLAVARKLNVSPLNLELGDPFESSKDSDQVFGGMRYVQYNYTIRKEQAEGVIASLYS